MNNTKEKLKEIEFAFSNLRRNQKIFVGAVMDLAPNQFYLSDQEALQAVGVVKEVFKLSANNKAELFKAVKDIAKKRGGCNCQ